MIGEKLALDLIGAGTGLRFAASGRIGSYANKETNDVRRGVEQRRDLPLVSFRFPQIAASRFEPASFRSRSNS
jgi:hypothetical protein